MSSCLGNKKRKLSRLDSGKRQIDSGGHHLSMNRSIMKMTLVIKDRC